MVGPAKGLQRVVGHASHLGENTGRDMAMGRLSYKKQVWACGLCGLAP